MRLFWESDDSVKDLIFVQLSYFQLQHDCGLYYPAGRDDAMQLSTLQILPEIGFVGSLELCINWNTLLHKYL